MVNSVHCSKLQRLQLDWGKLYSHWANKIHHGKKRKLVNSQTLARRLLNPCDLILYFPKPIWFPGWSQKHWRKPQVPFITGIVWLIHSTTSHLDVLVKRQVMLMISTLGYGERGSVLLCLRIRKWFIYPSTVPALRKYLCLNIQQQ